MADKTESNVTKLNTDVAETKMGEAVLALEKMMPQVIQMSKLRARQRKILFDAYRESGFNETQAMDLIKNERGF